MLKKWIAICSFICLVLMACAPPAAESTKVSVEVKIPTAATPTAIAALTPTADILTPVDNSIQDSGTCTRGKRNFAVQWLSETKLIFTSRTMPTIPGGAHLPGNIHVYDILTGKVICLTSDGIFNHSPRASHDGEWIAYISWTASSGQTLNLVKPDGTAHRTLLNNRPTGQYIVSAEWIGKRRIMLLTSDGVDFKLFTIDIHSEELHEVETFPEMEGWPSVYMNPHSHQSMIIVASDGKSLQAWLVDENGIVSKEPWKSNFVVWAPNGYCVATSEADQQERWQLDVYVVCKVSETELTRDQITATINTSETPNEWTKDQTLIITLRSVEDSDIQTSRMICEISITAESNPKPKCLTPKGQYSAHPVLAPNGAYIAFSVYTFDSGSVVNLYIMDRDGENVMPVP